MLKSPPVVHRFVLDQLTISCWDFHSTIARKSMKNRDYLLLLNIFAQAERGLCLTSVSTVASLLQAELW